ncbi:MAG: hypothetical protein PHH00_03215 [Candidatus Nanoarchaeia archaeon]|nr:hypothetical protein [Candidatus Nanoarchaeia archaeon]
MAKQTTRNTEQLYETAVSVVRSIFYRTFRQPKYDAQDIPHVSGAYRASLANGEREPFVELTIWHTGGLPRISIGTGLPEACDDVRRLADKIEKKRVGYISWECDFARHESDKKGLPRLLEMLKGRLL